MKLILLTLLFNILTFTLTAQTNIYVSNSGTNPGTSLPTINNPVETLKNAYDYIKSNLSNANNQATTPVNVYLMDDGGDILVADSDLLVWEVSGTLLNPITITSLSNRATLSRNSDHSLMLRFKNVNHISIKYIDFNKITEGAIQLDNCDYNIIRYCSFHGDGNFESVQKSGVIWVGVRSDNGYEGENTLSSSNNNISYNLFYDLKVDDETGKHQGIYLSNGAYDNTIAYNYINFAPCHGILGQHGDYQDNYISSNLVSTKFRVEL